MYCILYYTVLCAMLSVVVYCIVLYCILHCTVLYTALYCIVYCCMLFCLLSVITVHQHHLPCLWLKKLLLFSLVMEPFSASSQLLLFTLRGLLWTTILFSVENLFSFGAFSQATKPFSSDSQLAETPHKGGYPLKWLWESAVTKSKIKNTLGYNR